MKDILRVSACLLPFLCVTAQASETQIPADVRWRENLTRFFFINSGDTTELSHAFSRSTTKWQPGNFHIETTTDASNNQACKPRPPNIRIVNFASFGSRPCGKDFGTDTLAVTFVQWNNATREILAADIVFNTAHTWAIYNGSLSGRPDFQRVAVHELGHAGGLNDNDDTTSIMFRKISNVESPSSADAGRLRSKYATPLPPSSPVPSQPGPCSFDSPFPLKHDVGPLNSTTYRSGGCIDGTRRPETTFYFYISASKRVGLGIAAEKAELNVQLLQNGNTVVWQSANNGQLVKSSGLLNLPAGEHGLRVWPATPTVTAYNVSFELE